MRTLYLSTRDVVLLLIAFILNNVQITQMANNHMDISPKDLNIKTTNNGNSSFTSVPFHHRNNSDDNIQSECPTNIECDKLMFPCIKCNMTNQCTYGAHINVTCSPLPQVSCLGKAEFERVAQCRYCYQTEHWEHRCVQKANCNSVASPRQYYRTNCTVLPDVICLGRREFAKRVPCNWTGGARWGTALVLSLTLGGFGADRFYLGHWQEGIGKLFSFGGLGVWTLLDVVLISVHHLGPADEKKYFWEIVDTSEHHRTVFQNQSPCPFVIETRNLLTDDYDYRSS